MIQWKDAVTAALQTHRDRLFALGCDIFDHPEPGREEYYASDLLTAFLAQRGFEVERGVGGLETAFRATWERGSGGPAIGFMMEYDACGGWVMVVATISRARCVSAQRWR